jgi:hypothetical protein
MLDDSHYYFVCKTHFSGNFAFQRKSRHDKEQTREGNKQHKREHTESTQRALQECCRSAQRSLTSISVSMGSGQPRQRAWQECLRSAQRWLTSISAAMTSALSGEGGFELRGAVKALAFVCRHLALLALCHLFSRQATRKSDILYTYSVVAFGLALSL